MFGSPTDIVFASILGLLSGHIKIKLYVQVNFTNLSTQTELTTNN